MTTYALSIIKNLILCHDNFSAFSVWCEMKRLIITGVNLGWTMCTFLWPSWQMVKLHNKTKGINKNITLIEPLLEPVHAKPRKKYSIKYPGHPWDNFKITVSCTWQYNWVCKSLLKWIHHKKESEKLGFATTSCSKKRAVVFDLETG